MLSISHSVASNLTLTSAPIHWCHGMVHAIPHLPSLSPSLPPSLHPALNPPPSSRFLPPSSHPSLFPPCLTGLQTGKRLLLQVEALLCHLQSPGAMPEHYSK